MSAAEDQPFVPKSDRAEAYADDAAAQKEDAAVAESEQTGKISKDEVEGLKDSIGGGEIIDDSEGYTRGAKKEGGYQQAEDELDSKVEAAE